MTIYSTAAHRRIYEQQFGPIPKEENGRTYEIHHIDGNHFNNSIDNLVAVSIQEHYDIHYKQGDWGACYYIGLRMQMTPAELSVISKNRCEYWVIKGIHPWQTRNDGSSSTGDRVNNGTHPWLKGNSQTRMSSMKAAELNNDRVRARSHNFLARDNGTSVASDRVSSGTHHFLRRPDGSSIQTDRVKAGTHHFLKDKTGNKNPNYDSTIYNFIHVVTGEIIASSRYDFYTFHQPYLTSSQVYRLVHGKAKKYNDWALQRSV